LTETFQIKAHLAAEYAQLNLSEFDMAEIKYRQALKIDPCASDALLGLGHLRYKRGDLLGAIEWGERAKDAESNRPGALALIGTCLIKLERYAEAKTIFIELIEYSHGDPRPRLQVALCDEKIGDLHAAETRLRHEINRVPLALSDITIVMAYLGGQFPANAYNQLARVLQLSGKLEEAKLHYALAKRYDPMIKLDRLYLEIVSDIELDKICSFQSLIKHKMQSGPLRWILLSRLEPLSLLENALQSLNGQYDLIELGYYAAFAQRKGALYVSARLRHIENILSGDQSSDLYASLLTVDTRRLFDLVERVLVGDISRNNAVVALADLVLSPDTFTQLITLANKFVKSHPQSGEIFAWTIAEVASHPALIKFRIQSLKIVGEAYERIGRFEAAAGTYSCIEQMTYGSGWSGMAINAKTDFARVRAAQGHVSEAEALLEEATAQAESIGDIGALNFALDNRIQIQLHVGAYGEALENCKRMLKIVEMMPDPSPELLGRLHFLTANATLGQIPAKLASRIDVIDNGRANIPEPINAEIRPLWS
jgi:tetratricopeptide (TPR) repeat protein